MTGNVFTMTYRTHCAACRWDGPERATATGASDDMLIHAETGQRRRNIERREDVG